MIFNSSEATKIDFRQNYLFILFLGVLGVISSKQSEKVSLTLHKWRHHVILVWKRSKSFPLLIFAILKLETSSKLHWNVNMRYHIICSHYFTNYKVFHITKQNPKSSDTVLRWPYRCKIVDVILRNYFPGPLSRNYFNEHESTKYMK